MALRLPGLPQLIKKRQASLFVLESWNRCVVAVERPLAVEAVLEEDAPFKVVLLKREEEIARSVFFGPADRLVEALPGEAERFFVAVNVPVVKI